MTKATEKNANKSDSVAIELTDIYEVAILRLQNIPYSNLAVIGGRIKFIFADSSAAKEVLRQFYEGLLSVDPKAYKHAVQDIRSVIYSMKRGNTS